MRLSQMQDIGGCRAVVANITAVDKLAALFRKGVSKNPTGRHQILGEPKNYIASPKADGYRSIHYTFRYQTKSPELEIYNGQRIEIQIRSRLQHAWATAVETVDTMTGQSIKFALGSNVGDPQWKRFFALMGSAIALRERRHLVPGTPQLRAELTGELRAVSTEIDAQRVLTGLGETVRVLEQSPNKKAFAYLLVLNAKTRSISVFSFSRDKLQDVEREYLRIEKENDPDVQAVQVSVEEIASLRAAYPNYYLDTRAFVEALQEAIKT